VRHDGSHPLAPGGSKMDGTAQSPAAVAPVTRAARVGALDTLRGVAVLGILIMNIAAFGLLLPAYFSPLADGGGTGINLRVYEVVTVLFEGTMRGLFSLLFGAGIVLLTQRMEDAGAGILAAEIHFRRMLWLMAFGLIHWVLLLWLGEILFAYSMCGLLLFAPRKLAPRLQLAIAGSLLALSVVHAQLAYSETRAALADFTAAEQARTSGATLDATQQSAIEGWQERVGELAPDEGTVAFFEGYHSGSWWNAVTSQFEVSAEFQWVHFPEYALFDMIPFMLIGMALLRWGVLTGGAPTRVYLAMVIVGYGIGLPLGIYEVDILVANDFSPLAVAESERTYQISRLAMLAGHLGLLLLAIRAGILMPLQRALAAVGQMALSNYLMQTVICTVLFYEFGPGLGLYSDLERYQLYYVVAGIWAAELAWSPLWLRYFRFGPFEWLWRSLTYWKLQPMRRGPAAPPAEPALGTA
jgi:uncharacterized protein